MNNTAITGILLKFAMAHDWGRNAIITGGAIGIYDESEQTVVYFGHIADLRAWAGY